MNIFRIATVSTILISAFLLLAACGGSGESGMKQIAAKKTDDNLTVTLSGENGQLRNGKQELTLAFTDADGKPAEISAATLNFNMPAMGSMAEMNDAATLTTTGTPGVFNAAVSLQMPGEWQAQITYEGKAGKGKTSFGVTAR